MRNLQNIKSLSSFAKKNQVSSETTYYTFLFDGANDNSAIADDSSYEGLSAGTIELFFKTSYSGGYQKLFQKPGVYDIGITQDFGGGAKLFAEVNGVKNFGELTGDIADGSWHHFAMAWDASDIESWFDGTRVGSDTGGTSLTSADPGRIGWNGSSEFFNGNIGFFRFSSTKRYAGASITVPTAPFTTDGNTLILPDYTLGSGNTVTDLSGNGNDLILDATNPPAWSEGTPF